MWTGNVFLGKRFFEYVADSFKEGQKKTTDNVNGMFSNSLKIKIKYGIMQSY